MKGNLVSIYAGHDANVSFYDAKTNTYHVIELERLVKKRYFRLHVDNNQNQITEILLDVKKIAKEYWNIDNNYEAILMGSDGWIHPKSLLNDIFGKAKIRTLAKHHMCHAASAFYQSNFKEALIISYDGGGDDGFFNIYKANSKQIRQIKRIKSDFGGGYLIFSSLIREVTENSKDPLSLSGKLMGLCAYGEINHELLDSFSQYFMDRNFKALSNSLNIDELSNLNPWSNPLKNWIFEDQQGFNIAATAQRAFENKFISILKKYDEDLPLILTGGCALNVLLNERIKKERKGKIYIPPNPNDCGLSLGHLFIYKKPEEKVNITYSGLPILDINKLPFFIKEFNATKVTKAQIAELLFQGNIIGVVYGDSEVGPRALGNRSIICNPNIKSMKEILNSKIKFREWYRPFAPFCKLEEAHKFFESPSFENLEYMSYAPKVKEEFVEKLPSITHIDNTARLQTVTMESHSHFYSILEEFGKLCDVNVLLNTSFNIRGKPILSTIEDALYILNNTQIDYVVVEDYLFKKS